MLPFWYLNRFAAKRNILTRILTTFWFRWPLSCQLNLKVAPVSVSLAGHEKKLQSGENGSEQCICSRRIDQKTLKFENMEQVDFGGWWEFSKFYIKLNMIHSLYFWLVTILTFFSKPRLYFFGADAVANSELGKNSERVSVWRPWRRPLEKRTTVQKKRQMKIFNFD